MRVRRVEAGPAGGRGRREDRQGAPRLGRQGDRPDRQAQGHPLRRQSAEDALRQDHAPALARARQERGDHAGRLDTGESGDSGAAEADALRRALRLPGFRWRVTGRPRRLSPATGVPRFRGDGSAARACRSAIAMTGDRFQRKKARIAAGLFSFPVGGVRCPTSPSCRRRGSDTGRARPGPVLPGSAPG